MDADLQQVIDAVGALADGPGSPLIVVSPRGVRGNPYDPTFVRPQAMTQAGPGRTVCR